MPPESAGKRPCAIRDRVPDLIRSHAARHRCPSGTAIVAFLLLSLTLPAQQPTAPVTWQGALHDAAGAPIAQATIRLANNASSAQSTTAPDGSFHLAPLSPGQYRLSVETRGRKFAYPSPITISQNAPPSLLTLSGSHLSVATEQTTSATGGEQLSSQAVSELPLNKRDFSPLLLLAAGTMTDANGATNFTAQFAINGQRGVEATFAMDGADISDPEMGGSTFSQLQRRCGRGDSIQLRLDARRDRPRRCRIHQHRHALRRQRLSRLVLRVSCATPPSTRATTSTTPRPPIPAAFRPSAATSSDSPTAARSIIPHLYDGRKRTFYFTQYQGFRQVLGTTQVMPVPTAAERAGIDTVTHIPTVDDTLTVPVDPGIAAILARYPCPTTHRVRSARTPTRRPRRWSPTPTSSRCGIDHNFIAKDQFFARFNIDNLTGPTTNPDQTAIDPILWR